MGKGRGEKESMELQKKIQNMIEEEKRDKLRYAMLVAEERRKMKRSLRRLVDTVRDTDKSYYGKENENEEYAIDLCPCCGAELIDQFDFYEYLCDYTCSECDAKLHREDESEPFYIVDEAYICPNCGASLLAQDEYDESFDEYICSECGAELTQDEYDDFDYDEYDNETDRCPCCGADLSEQYDYCEYFNDYVCSECSSALHRDDYQDVFEVIDEEEYYDDFVDSTPVSEMLNDNLMPLYDDSDCREIQQKRYLEYLATLEIKREEKARKRAAWMKLWNIMLGKKLSVPLSSLECKGKHYNEVVDAFCKAGFVRISINPVDDLRIDMKSLEGTVIGINIRNNIQFDKLSKHRITSKIVICYHTVHLVTPPLTSKKAKRQKLNQVIDAFKSAGFNNIETVPLNDLKPDRTKKDKLVATVSIDGCSKYSPRAKVRIDSRITINYHSAKMRY